MRSEHHGDATISRTVKILIEGGVLLQLLVTVRHNADETAREDAAHPRLLDHLGNALHIRSVHIGKARRSAADHLDGGKHCTPVDIIGAEFCLDRPDHLLQPVHELHIVCIAAQEGHRCMCMRIHKAGDCKMRRTINDLVCVKVMRYISNSRDTIIRNGDIGSRSRPIRQKRSDVLNQRIQCTLSYASPRYSFCSALSSSMETPRELSLIFAISTLISSGMR